VAIRAFAEVRDGHVIAAAEAFAVFVAGGWGNGGTAEFHRRVHVRGAVAFDVAAAGFAYESVGRPATGSLTMGFFFGGVHLAYGAYLYLTEKRKMAA